MFTIRCFIKPWGRFNVKDFKGERKREGLIIKEVGKGLFTKSNESIVADRITGMFPHSLRDQHTILRVKCKNSKQFL